MRHCLLQSWLSLLKQDAATGATATTGTMAADKTSQFDMLKQLKSEKLVKTG